MLTKERKGEIALVILKFKMYKSGECRLSPELMREVNSVANRLGIPVEEVKEFLKEIALEFLDKAFK